MILKTLDLKVLHIRVRNAINEYYLRHKTLEGMLLAWVFCLQDIHLVQLE
jgi:hypothetical protein